MMKGLDIQLINDSNLSEIEGKINQSFKKALSESDYCTITIINSANKDGRISTIDAYKNQTTLNAIQIEQNASYAILKIESTEKIESIALFNAHGNLVGNVENSSFTVERLHNGIYFIAIKTISGIAHRKFRIQ